MTIPNINDIHKLSKRVLTQEELTKLAKVKKIDDPNLWLRNPPIRNIQLIPTSWLDIKISEGIQYKLGKISFDACLNFYMQDYDLKRKDFVFQHGTEYILPDGKILIGSYHPSPRNVNTGRIDENKMGRLLKKVKKVMDR